MDKQYDIIIIGSGLGGLQCGVILSRKGYKVLVLEKNKQIGGSLQTFKRNGCTFSTGIHYIGSLDEGQTLNKIFKYFKLFDGIEYKRLNSDGFDIFNIDGTEYHFPIGFSNFKKQMYDYFPSEKDAIDKYVAEIKNTVNNQDIYLLKNAENGSSAIGKHLSMNAWDYINSITKNTRLQQVLSALNFVYAGVKEKSPFYIHALINNHFITSSYRIVGNTGLIAKKLKDEIIENGGDVHTNKKVVNLVINNNKISSVETKDHNKYFANNIISDVHPATTMDMIGEGLIKKSFRKRMKNKENTMSAFGVHISLKKNSLKYINANYNYYKRDDVWYASYYDEKLWPEHYFLHCGIPEKESEYTNCIGLLTHMKFEEVARWEELPVNKRGDDYEEFKNKKAKMLIELATKNFPQLRNNIVGFNVSTPLTYRDYLGTPMGSLYGTLHNFKNPADSYISPRTKISNLFFTGQNINLHGMLGVSVSSILTCGEFVGVNKILKEINGQA
ncbi:MAG: NAD(P)/FAD-dependent oxidoreductase [Bacteroidetes bacterium]|nr:NAD(P)/FAD-dependent oxidoreductase [Bacteroidota bacterium]MBL6943312.1 NAD(P)/FAD-dependent oxidoreductase [Bacteroidales bacterium]